MMRRVINADVVEWKTKILKTHPKPQFAVIIADVPDNIGLDYAGVHDKVPVDQYLRMLTHVCALGVHWPLWLSFNTRWLPHVGAIVSQMPVKVEPCVQVITFGSNQKARTKLTDNQRPVWMIRPKSGRWKYQPVFIPSGRQKQGDKRANPTGKMPGNTFEFPRVPGNAKMRRSWHPTQLHDDFVSLLIRLAAPHGKTVVDLFSGTGTTSRMCEQLAYPSIAVELSPFYAKRIADDLGTTVETL